MPGQGVGWGLPPGPQVGGDAGGGERPLAEREGGLGVLVGECVALRSAHT